MKTRILLSGIALSLSVLAYAQENPTLEKQIKNYTVKIDSIVVAEKTKMNAELDAVDFRFNDGKISVAEKQKQRQEIAGRYEEIINEKVNAEQSELDEITRQHVRNSIFGKEGDTNSVEGSSSNNAVISVKTGDKKKHPKDLLKTSGLVLSFGFPTLTNNDEAFNFFKNDSEIRFGQSGSILYALKWERQIGKFTSPFFVHYGLGLRTDGWDLGKSRVFAQANDQLFITPFEDGELKYSRLQTEYIEVPIDLRFVLNPKYVEHEGVKYLDATKNQFSIGLGVYGDVKISNRIRYRYSNEESSKNILRQKVENGVNPFLFGAKFSVGYGGLNLFLKKDLTPVFNSDAQLNNKYGLQIGLELASLNF